MYVNSKNKNLKYKILFLCFLFFTLKVKSQAILDSIFSAAHGIAQNEITFYEVEGYNVFNFIFNYPFDKESIEKIKKQYHIKSNEFAIKDKDLKYGKCFVDTQIKTKTIFQSDIFYLFPIEQNKIVIIGFQTFLIRDEQLEQIFAKSILNKNVPKSSFTKMKLDSVNFVGRTLKFEFNCNWKRPHNVQCPFLGQMNWAVFRNENRAKEYLKKQHELTAIKDFGEIIHLDTVDVIFENNETKAIKSTYKFALSSLEKTGSNTLVIYYICCKVRGKYVACILSHYSDEADENELPPLINEVMKLKL